VKKFFHPFAAVFICSQIFVLTFCRPAYCELAVNAVSVAGEDAVAEPEVSSEELVQSAWVAAHRGDEAAVDSLLAKCLQVFGAEAQKQQSGLSGFPAPGREKDYQALNDVATMFFIKAEFFMNHGKPEEAAALFARIIKEYKWAQAWDPRGWFWSVAEKSQDSIDVMSGKAEDEAQKQKTTGLRTLPRLANPGKEPVVDYRKFGQFQGVGTQDYRYEITDSKGLALAVGEGIYPNTTAIKDPGYKKLKEEGRLEGSHWDFNSSDDLEAAFLKWATASEPEGIKLFYLGRIFEKAKMYYEAIKAYHALIVHFPQTTAKTYWQTPWYPAQAAIAEIKHLIRVHPELDLAAKWMKIEVRNGFDNDINNDVIVTYPGIIKKKNFLDNLLEKYLPARKANLKKVKRTLGSGAVKLVQYENGHWQMLVDGKPFVIKGITYMPTRIGQSPDKNTQAFWMEEDTNNNGLADGPYDAWVDKNRNNKQDGDEPVEGDFKLMKDMGVNTLRIYYHPFKPDKEFLRKMHAQFGFYVGMENFLGKYAMGSGAAWDKGTDYDNPEHRKNMMENVRKMVLEFKDEPYVLLWILGNENNYGVGNNADKKPEAYFKFVNEVAKMIKSLDPNHPVAICNGDTLYLDIFARYAPEVDIFSANLYRGDYGFGSFWEQVFDATGKPAFVTEYGAPAYASYLSPQEAEQQQEDYHRGCWYSIADNLAGSADGVGNALGGFVFEWVDEWWKNYEPFRHDRKSDAIGPFPGGYYYEEWFGITSQGNGSHSPFMRQLRKAYFAYQEMWTEPKGR